jgi:ribonuclease HI
VFFDDDQLEEISVRLPPHLHQSNQAAEITAIHEALQLTKPKREIIIESDSKYAINESPRKGIG